jgi:hypothetical protein
MYSALTRAALGLLGRAGASALDAERLLAKDVLPVSCMVALVLFCFLDRSYGKQSN